MKAIIEAALRNTLETERRPHKKANLETHVFKGNGLQAGLSWDNWAGIRAMSYEGRGG